jgi:uncharacterized RmlC-like cupin family protein
VTKQRENESNLVFSASVSREDENDNVSVGSISEVDPDISFDNNATDPSIII